MSFAPPSTRQIAQRFLKYMGGGLVVTSIPVGAWWYTAVQHRAEVAKDVATRIRIPNVQTMDDYLIEKCQPGDVLVFDRRCERCATSPWAALACLASKAFLCDPTSQRTVEEGRFDHIGEYCCGI
jgi:hypothetical protein